MGRRFTRSPQEVLELVPDQLIVLSWKNKARSLALDRMLAGAVQVLGHHFEFHLRSVQSMGRSSHILATLLASASDPRAGG